MKRIENYWKTDYLFNIPVWHQYMSRNRFQLILRCLYFNKNLSGECSDRLHKVIRLLNYFNNRMKEINIFTRETSVDESMLP